MSLKILVDLDNTVVDLLSPWLAWLNSTHGTDVKASEVVDWDLVRCVPGEVGYKVFDFFKQPIYRTLQPFPNAVETLRSWHKAGHEVMLVTWTSPKFSAEGSPHFNDKCAWVRENLDFLPQSALMICDARRRIPADIYIDDRPSATREYREHHPATQIWGVRVAPYVEGDQYNIVVDPDNAWATFAESLSVVERGKDAAQRVCMTPLLEGGLCMTVDCQAHKEIAAPTGAFYPKSVWRMLGRMSGDKTLDTVDAEIAYTRELAQDIRNAQMPPHLKYKLIQDNLKLAVDLVEKREKLLVARQFLLPHQTMKVILLRIQQILKRHISDEHTLNRVGKEIGQIDVANTRAALALVGD